jgi:hypothetical protein
MFFYKKLQLFDNFKPEQNQKTGQIGRTSPYKNYGVSVNIIMKTLKILNFSIVFIYIRNRAQNYSDAAPATA